MERRWLLFFILLVVVSFGYSLGFSFVLDDGEQIVKNPLVRGDVPYLDIFTHPTWPGNVYRPFVTFSYRLTEDLFGFHPLWFHLSSILLHLVVVLLAYSFLKRILKDSQAAIAASVFAVMPIHLEAVVNISNRTELLAAIGVLSALLLSVSRRERTVTQLVHASLAAALLFLVGMLSKESTLSLVILLPLCWWYLSPQDMKRQMLFVGGFAAALIGYLVLRTNAFGGLGGAIGEVAPLDNPLISMSPTHRIANGIVLIGRYLLLSVFPWRLRSDYSHGVIPPIQDGINLEHMIDILSLLMLFCLFLYGVLRNRQIVFCTLWFLFSFLVTSNILFPIGTIFADRLAYLPSLGIAGLIAILLSSFRDRRWARVSLSLYLLLCVGKTIYESRFWSSDSALTWRTLQVSPQSAKAHGNAAFFLLKEGKVLEAEEHYRQAIHIYPALDIAFNGLGKIAYHRANYQEAVKMFTNALEINPRNQVALTNLGSVYFDLGVYDKARVVYEKVLELHPGTPRALIGLFGIATVTDEIDLGKRLDQTIHSHGAIRNDPVYLQIKAEFDQKVEERGSQDIATKSND